MDTWVLVPLSLKFHFLNNSYSENDVTKIGQLKQHLCQNFQTKDLGCLKYILGIEVAQSKEDIMISQRKYTLHTLKETRIIDYRPMHTPMNQNKKIVEEQIEPFSDPNNYKRLVGKLIYLTITRRDLSLVGEIGQYMQALILISGILFFASSNTSNRL